MTTYPIPLAERAKSFTSFKVMDIMEAVRELQQQGRDIIRMDVGEPRFDPPPPLQEAAHRALDEQPHGYTPPCGIAPLREAIAEHYRDTHRLSIAPERVIVTTGSSAALNLLCDLLFNPGDGVLLTDPGYPCNPNFLRRCGLQPQTMEVNASSGFQPTPELVNARWQNNTRGVIIASPGNPTGEIMADATLREIHRIIEYHRGALLVDELYHGLTYTAEPPTTALSISDNAFVINGFSKYFGMTGWRLGWIVAPEFCLERLNAMIQNFYIASPTLSQYVALAALQPEAQVIFRQRRDEFRKRRDFLAPELQRMGFGITRIPDGGFYLYADISRFSDDCEAFCRHLLYNHGIACTPGTDFGQFQAHKHIRFSYTEPLERLEEAIHRLEQAVNPR